MIINNIRHRLPQPVVKPPLFEGSFVLDRVISLPLQFTIDSLNDFLIPWWMSLGDPLPQPHILRYTGALWGLQDEHFLSVQLQKRWGTHPEDTHQGNQVHIVQSCITRSKLKKTSNSVSLPFYYLIVLAF